MRNGILYLMSAVFLLAGCSGPAKSRAQAHQDQLAAPAPYVRIENTDSNRIQLQIAVRQFLPLHRGEPVVWLAGVSHIGQSNYYTALQMHLDEQTLVLFEGVGAAQRDAGTHDSHPAAAPATTSLADDASKGVSLQSAMAASLGLVFQLEAIDYRRPNFRNSDLSISQLRQLMAQAETASGETGAKDSLEDLLQLMDGDSWFNSLLQLALRFLGANPKLQALGRLALIDLLGQLQGDPSRLQGLPPDMKQLLEVLLQRRNEKVLADLKPELPRVGRHGSIAIFFGTGHMPDLETRLRREFDYRPARQIWLTAFDVNLAQAKITPAERAFIDDFVRWQLSAAGASRPGSN